LKVLAEPQGENERRIVTDTQYGTANDGEQERKVRQFFALFAELRAWQAEFDKIVGYSTPEGEVLCRACAEGRGA
jgi:hypothetical protein